MGMTRGQWAIQFLQALGNTQPSASTVNFVASWTLAENTRALYNPLATTQPADGATCFNSVCVRNYLSNGQGIDASVKTLTNGRYPHILQGLRTNQPEDAANAVELGIWGTGMHGVLLWRTGDHRDGKLLSHPDTSDAADDGPRIVGDAGGPTQSPGNLPPTSPDIPQPSGGSVMDTSDSAQLARDVQYILLGGLLVAIALFLALKSYVPTSSIVKAVA